MRRFVICLIFSLFIISACFADTFTHRTTGETCDGFATQQVRAGKTLVRSADSESSRSVNLSEYDIQWNFRGRRNNVIVISIKDQIALESETALFEKAIEAASNQGPLFIVLAIDTPGGRQDLMKRICQAISSANNCKTVAYICGGQYGGAYSAGAIISMACDYIYMADNTAIGAATTILISSEGQIKDLKSEYGETVGEKFMSADRAFVAAVAEENGRSPALARAMVDKDIKIIEVIEDGKTKFIEPKDKRNGQTVVRTLNEKGKLLTLAASDAVQSRLADGKANSLEELIHILGADGARVIQNSDSVKARREFEKCKKSYNEIMERADRIQKELDNLTQRADFIADEYNKVNHNFEIGNREELMRKYTAERQTLLRDIARNLKQLISLYKDALKLNKRCTDLNLDVQSFEKVINSAQIRFRSVLEEMKD